MNGRIKELAEHAGLKTELWNNPEPFVIYKEDVHNPGGLIKFAELIVLECAMVVWNDKGRYNCSEQSNRIREHFGVDSVSKPEPPPGRVFKGYN